MASDLVVKRKVPASRKSLKFDASANQWEKFCVLDSYMKLTWDLDTKDHFKKFY